MSLNESMTGKKFSLAGWAVVCRVDGKWKAARHKPTGTVFPVFEAPGDAEACAAEADAQGVPAAVVPVRLTAEVTGDAFDYEQWKDHQDGRSRSWPSV